VILEYCQHTVQPGVKPPPPGKRMIAGYLMAGMSSPSGLTHHHRAMPRPLRGAPPSSARRASSSDRRGLTCPPSLRSGSGAPRHLRQAPPIWTKITNTGLTLPWGSLVPGALNDLECGPNGSRETLRHVCVDRSLTRARPRAICRHQLPGAMVAPASRIKSAQARHRVRL
jgi:hypothetical protein